MDSSASSKISPLVLVVVVWAFTGVALISACLRSVVVWRYRGGFSIDDALLIFACAGLLAGSILTQIGYPTLFLAQRMSVYPDEAFADPNLLDDLVRFQVLDYTWEILGWIIIFVIKFAFLSFFKPLIAGLPRVEMYWRVVFGFTFLAFAFCVSSSFIACPKLGRAICRVFHGLEVLLLTLIVACSSSKQWAIALATGPITITVDILADLAIVSMPYYLVWRVKVGPRKKLGVLVFLGLQTLMIVIAIIRVAGCRMANTLDIPWIMSWQHIEASVSISTLSIAAFKSFYVANQRLKNISYPTGTVCSSTLLPGTRTTVTIEEGQFELCHDELRVSVKRDWHVVSTKCSETDSGSPPARDGAFVRIESPGID